jgi:peptidoglycan-associated lipoprotein
MDSTKGPQSHSREAEVAAGAKRNERKERAMKRMHFVGLMILCATIVSVGCGKKVPPATAAGGGTSVPTTQSAPPAPPRSVPSDTTTASKGLTDDELFAQKTLDQLNAERPLADVHFDLDDWQIGEEGRIILQKNAAWLKRWSSTRITVEGHCDDRGTGEYNIALGERRANAVKDYLSSLGVTPDRVLIVSMGEEAPVCTDSSENCWHLNRRGHPVITAK